MFNRLCVGQLYRGAQSDKALNLSLCYLFHCSGGIISVHRDCLLWVDVQVIARCGLIAQPLRKLRGYDFHVQEVNIIRTARALWSSVDV